MKQRGIVVLTIMTTFLGLGLSVFAAEFPTKPINLVIQYPAGGSTDLTSRALANGVKKYLGQPVVCENKPGGGGTVGVNLVATKPADGYTIGIVTSSPIMAFHMGKLNFHPLNDLTPIIRWGNYIFGIVVRSDSNFQTMQELMQYIKQNPEKMTYGSAGVGTPPHLAVEELSMVAGVKFTHIPGRGGDAGNNMALLGGHIDFVSDSSGWGPLVDAGKFRLLAMFSEKRCERYPQAPTMKEIGYDVVARSHLGVIGPKGMPQPVVAKIHDAFRKAMEDPEYKAVMKRLDMNDYYLNSEDYANYMKGEFDNVEKLVKRLGLDKK